MAGATIQVRMPKYGFPCGWIASTKIRKSRFVTAMIAITRPNWRIRLRDVREAVIDLVSRDAGGLQDDLTASYPTLESAPQRSSAGGPAARSPIPPRPCRRGESTRRLRREVR